MNDPWEVKSVRQSGQYISCMKINGVPLLPPVLSKECRKEMQYYKILAKEVEKRISLLQPYIIEGSDSDYGEQTDAPELLESEHSYESPEEELVHKSFHYSINEVPTDDTSLDNYLKDTEKSQCDSDVYVTSKAKVVNKSDTSSMNTSKYIIDFSLNINETTRDSAETKRPEVLPIDLPERDYNCPKKSTQKLPKEMESSKKDVIEDVETGSYNKYRNLKSDPYSCIPLNPSGPSSLSSKSFTGSLNNIYTESLKESFIETPLVRQRSYTLLQPSPQLLAHLEVQSLNTGVEMSCISMSDSLSNLSSPGKKRRSWDLESAKVKWSSLALELKQNGFNINTSNRNSRPVAKKVSQVSPPRARSVAPEKTRRNSVPSKVLPKSEPINSNAMAKNPRHEPVQQVKKTMSPVRKISTRTLIKEPVKSVAERVKEPISPKNVPEKTENSPPKLISESEDPATRVRELYEKIQKQQLVQMASLVEKQKREQLLLQQVFEEQNNLLYKQLKTIVPTSPVEVKEAWGDKQEGDRGPVSLSQLINHKSPEDSPVSSTLTETNHYINKCDSTLKKSRDITSSIKKQQPTPNGNKVQSTKTIPDGSRTRTHSPTQRTPASRRLNYDSSVSSDRELEPILTDRTNDTMADLNVTFPSDTEQNSGASGPVLNHLCGKEVTVIHRTPTSNGTSHKSPASVRTVSKPVSVRASNHTAPPTPQQQAAASRIVAHAKGYLVRRLMRTDRVQGIVQTIRDALLCALQLHQERGGIRGADVDLHRRLIQQITAACYSLHDTFVASSPAERCALIAADRGRRRSLANRPPHTPRAYRPKDVMSQSHSGAFPTRVKPSSASFLMTQSNYETFRDSKCPVSRSQMSPRRRPWR